MGFCDKLEIEYEDVADDRKSRENEHDQYEMDWVELELKEKERVDTPYKPIYAITSAVQHIGKKKKDILPQKTQNGKTESPIINGIVSIEDDDGKENKKRD